MAMNGSGITKLMEECGELTQICAKKLAYFDTDVHPDGNGSMKIRMEDEIGDVIAACMFVSEKLSLDSDRILERALKKTQRFKLWDTQT